MSEDRLFFFTASVKIEAGVQAPDLEAAKRKLSDLLTAQDGRVTLALSVEAFSLQLYDGPGGDPAVLLARIENTSDGLPVEPARRIFILAGSSRQAGDLARERGYEDWSYVSDPSDLHGVEGITLVVYGDAALRDDYDEVIAMAGSRRGSSVEYA